MPNRLSLRLIGLLLFSGIFLLFSSFNTGITEWKFDPEEATILFDIPGYHHSGEFGGLSGTFLFDEAFPEQTKIDAKIPVSSVRTGHHMLDWHLQRKGFFDAKHYPEISFHSTSVTKNDSTYIANGELTMKGVTKNISFPFQMLWNTSLEFVGEMQINAGDFGVGRKSKKGKDKVYITIEVHLKK